MKINGNYLMGCWLLVVGYWFSVIGKYVRFMRTGEPLCYPRYRAIQTSNQQPTTNNRQQITNNRQPTSNNQQPTTNNHPPTNACGRSRGHASEQGDRNYEARPIFPFRGSDQPFGYPIPRAFA